MLLEITAIFGFPSFRPTKRWIGAMPLHLGDAHLFAFSQDAQFRLQLLGKLPVIVFCVPPKGGGLQTGLPWESLILGFGNVSRQNTRSGPMTGFPSRALASPLFPTAPFSAAAVQISPAFVLCSRDTTGLVLDHIFTPSSPNLNFFPSSISPTPTSAAATRTFRGREAAG